jgi:hypothetical protein
MPTSQVPTYLEARVAAGHAVPVVEVILQHSEEEEELWGRTHAGGRDRRIASMSGPRRDPRELSDVAWPEVGQEERHAVVEYVVKGLNEALVTELLEGFHSGK